MREWLIIDLEASCWAEGVERPEKPSQCLYVNEIIEIGAVLFDPEARAIRKTYQAFVKPQANPVLTDFCKGLTHIQQADVDGADAFPVALQNLVATFEMKEGAQNPAFCSWGLYDKKQILSDCARHNLPYPFSLENHTNLKTAVARTLGVKRAGLGSVLRRMGLAFEGTQHRALDDVLNMVQILQKLDSSQYQNVLRQVSRATQPIQTRQQLLALAGPDRIVRNKGNAVEICEDGTLLRADVRPDLARPMTVEEAIRHLELN